MASVRFELVPSDQLEAEARARYAEQKRAAFEAQRAWEAARWSIEPHWTPGPFSSREMAIYELGFFMGSLSREPEARKADGIVRRQRLGPKGGTLPRPPRQRVLEVYLEVRSEHPDWKAGAKKAEVGRRLGGFSARQVDRWLPDYVKARRRPKKRLRPTVEATVEGGH